jgi:hypothetical protein
MAKLKAMVAQQNEHNHLVLEGIKAKKEEIAAKESQRFIPENARRSARTIQIKKKTALLNDDTEAQEKYHTYHYLRYPENLDEEEYDDSSPYQKPPKKPKHPPPPEKAQPSLPEISSNPAKAQAVIINTQQKTEKLKAAVDAQQKVEVEQVSEDVTKYHQMKKQIKQNKERIIGEILAEERNIEDLFERTFGRKFEQYAGNYLRLRKSVKDAARDIQNLSQDEIDYNEKIQAKDNQIQKNNENAEKQIALYEFNTSVQATTKARFKRENQQLENEKQALKNEHERNVAFLKNNLHTKQQEFARVQDEVQTFGNRTRIWKNKKADEIMNDLIPLHIGIDDLNFTHIRKNFTRKK